MSFIRKQGSEFKFKTVVIPEATLFLSGYPSITPDGQGLSATFELRASNTRNPTEGDNLLARNYISLNLYVNAPDNQPSVVKDGDGNYRLTYACKNLPALAGKMELPEGMPTNLRAQTYHLTGLLPALKEWRSDES